MYDSKSLDIFDVVSSEYPEPSVFTFTKRLSSMLLNSGLAVKNVVGNNSLRISLNISKYFDCQVSE